MPFDEWTFAQTHYFAEVERKKELNANAQIPIALASAYAAAIVTMVQSTEAEIGIFGAIVIAGCAIAAVALLAALYLLFRSYVGHAYCYLATPDSFLSWREQARTGGWTGRPLEEATEQMLAREYAAAATHNSGVNDKKSGFLHLANLALGATLAVLIVTAAPWLLEKVEDRDQSQISTSITMVSQDARGSETGIPASGPPTAATAAAQSANKGKRGAKGAPEGLKRTRAHGT